MNFVAICLHSCDMRDFHSNMRDTPFMDRLRRESVFLPLGRGQGHHQGDSLNTELTGIWTARYCDSSLTEEGLKSPENCRFPKTVIEYLEEDGYDLFTRISLGSPKLGTFAVVGGLERFWMKDEPQRLEQFFTPKEVEVPGDVAETYADAEIPAIPEMMATIQGSDKFFACFFVRETHRAWGQTEGLCALEGKPPGNWPVDAFSARKAALDKPDEFAALRRRGLASADKIVESIFKATQHLDDVTYLVYSNHGEVYDHFRYNLPYKNDGRTMIVGTSHGSYPYEVLYANMQMWVIPGQKPRVMKGIGRSVDIPATILDLAGIEHGPMDGESMLPLFAQGNFPDRERYAENQHRGPSAPVLGYGCLSMVRKDGYKIISTGPVKEFQEGEEKFGPDYHQLAVVDLNSDPYEYVNLIDSTEGQEVLEWAMNRHLELKDDAWRKS